MNKPRENRDTVRNDTVTITVTKEEKEMIFSDAKYLGLTVSAYCRWALLRGIKNSKLGE